jgi:hypothetical protein
MCVVGINTCTLVCIRKAKTGLLASVWDDLNRSSSREGPLGIYARSTPHQQVLDSPTLLEYLNDSRPSGSTPDKRRLQNGRKERNSQPRRSIIGSTKKKRKRRDPPEQARSHPVSTQPGSSTKAKSRVSSAKIRSPSSEAASDPPDRSHLLRRGREV